MNRIAIRLSVLAVGTAALMVVPAVTQAEAGSAHLHLKKHKRHWSDAVGGPVFIGEARPMIAPPSTQTSSVCPGIGRSFDCKIWPPPFDEDPDRKTSRY